MEEKSKWKQVYIGSGTHLDRVMEMYRELGYEIKLEPVSSEEPGGCRECYPPGELPYRLFVREVN